ncbi:MAG: hypothetical protein M0017_00465 [Desulfobacteraceae bacterium]|nr:hypothetical protein [Desulfobacteraceae bacterium]
MNQELKRVNVDFPVGVIEALDKKEAGRNQAGLVKTWIAERLEKAA